MRKRSTLCLIVCPAVPCSLLRLLPIYAHHLSKFEVHTMASRQANDHYQVQPSVHACSFLPVYWNHDRRLLDVFLWLFIVFLTPFLFSRRLWRISRRVCEHDPDRPFAISDQRNSALHTMYRFNQPIELMQSNWSQPHGRTSWRNFILQLEQKWCTIFIVSSSEVYSRGGESVHCACKCFSMLNVELWTRPGGDYNIRRCDRNSRSVE
jgi:hypothetical protein